MISSLVDLSVQRICRLVYDRQLDVSDVELPHELVAKVVVYICQNGLLSARSLKAYLRANFTFIAVPGAILLDDECVDVITSTCPLVKSVNCAFAPCSHVCRALHAPPPQC